MPRFPLLLLAAVLTGPVGAEHVTDKLLAGFYDQASTDQQPIKVLPSGTPLEVLKAEEEFTQVRLADGKEGWVKTLYVSREKPAKALLLEQQARTASLERQLDRAREELRALGAGEVPIKTQTDDQALREQLTEAQARIEVLEGQLSSISTDDALKDEINRLRGQARQAADLLKQGLEQSMATDPSPAIPMVTKQDIGPLWGYWPWLGMLLTTMVGFALGVWFIDYRIRKRYGGFRL